MNGVEDYSACLLGSALAWFLTISVSVASVVEEKANLNVSEGDAMAEVTDLIGLINLYCPLCLSKKTRRFFDGVRIAAGSYYRKGKKTSKEWKMALG